MRWGMVQMMVIRNMSIFCIVVFTCNVFAKDLGKAGATFKIEEEGFTEMMKRKLETVDMEEERKKMEKIARNKIQNPNPVPNIYPATKGRVFYYDPSYVVKEDILLPCGEILHKAGTRVNPLTEMDLNRRLFFIDAREVKQIEWVKDKLTPPAKFQSKIIEDRVILVAGSVFDTEENLVKAAKNTEEDQQEQQTPPIFFDQHGELTTKFGIKASPAIAKQEGDKLRIEEINLNE